MNGPHPQMTSIVPMEETTEFKKARMKEVRTMVARAHKQGKRIDQMGFTGTDIPRAMIALQDLLAKSEDRHKKATEWVFSAKDILQDAAHFITYQQARIGELNDKLYDERISHQQTAMLLDMTFTEKRRYEDDFNALKRSLEIING